MRPIALTWCAPLLAFGEVLVMPITEIIENESEG